MLGVWYWGVRFPGQLHEEVTMGKKFSVIVLIGVALLLIFSGFGGQALVSAEEPVAIVPFKATYQTFPDVVGGGFDYIVLEIPAVGIGTHLGKSEWYAESKVSFTTFPWTQTAKEMVFTAANGDRLIGHFAGEAVPNEFGGADYWGEYWITEGTGRFSGTTGSGTYNGGAGEDTGTLTFEGTLTNP